MTPSRLNGMEPTAAGELVTIATGAAPIDGIVFDTPSATKVVVAIIDPARGPVFRTLRPETLSSRTRHSSDDRALRLLIRRTPPPTHRAARSGSDAGQRRAGHARAATHRTADR
jgi:hypothetical protein